MNEPTPHPNPSPPLTPEKLAEFQHKIATGADLITEERARQILRKGYSAKSDDSYEDGELLRASQSYIEASTWHGEKDFKRYDLDDHPWPWDQGFNPGDPVDAILCLVKAGALIAAEIDRLKRIQTP